jgi:protein-disulfide isomerase
MIKKLLVVILLFLTPLFAKEERDYDSVPHISYGESKAGILIDEYASLSCSHCRAFNESVFPDILKNYIDTGKVYYRFFHFPLDRNSLQAAKLVQCFENEKGAKLLDTLFKTQNEWGHESEVQALNKLRNVALVSGISKEKFEGCITNVAMEDAILKHQLEVSQKLNINSTPTILINGKVYNGSRSYDKISEELLKLRRK